jgi:hypothetical protein
MRIFLLRDQEPNMYDDERETRSPRLPKWTTLPWLLAAGLVLLIGFGIGWASGRAANEPVPTPTVIIRRLPMPILPPDATSLPPVPADQGKDTAEAAPPAKLTTAVAIE